MKIALFSDTYKPQLNGVVAYLSDAISLLSKENQVILFAPGENHFRMEEVSTNLTIYWIPSSPFPFYEGYRIASIDYKRVSHILNTEQPDVVHAHAPINLGLQGIIAAKRKRIPCVITYHTHFPDYVPHLLNGKLPGLIRSLGDYTAKKFVKHIFKMADVVAAPTYELVHELRSYGLRNVVHLPNGIDPKKLDCTKKEVNAFRKAHGLSRGKKIILYLGRLSFEKRVDELLEAFSHIETRGRILLIAGGGPYLRRFQEFAKALGLKNVVFTGYVRHPAAAYRCADIFASASDSETFGLTFIEAMQAGLPVIGVRKLGAKEVITHMKNGLLAEPGDRIALSKAMEKLLKDRRLRKKMGGEGQKTAKKYSIENSVRKTLEIYEEIIGRR